MVGKRKARWWIRLIELMLMGLGAALYAIARQLIYDSRSFGR